MKDLKETTHVHHVKKLFTLKVDWLNMSKLFMKVSESLVVTLVAKDLLINTDFLYTLIQFIKE